MWWGFKKCPTNLWGCENLKRSQRESLKWQDLLNAQVKRWRGGDPQRGDLLSEGSGVIKAQSETNQHLLNVREFSQSP